MFPRIVPLQDTWRHRGEGGVSGDRMRRSHGLESTRSLIEHVRLIEFKWRCWWKTRGFAIGNQPTSDGCDPSWLRLTVETSGHIDGSPWRRVDTSTRGSFGSAGSSSKMQSWSGRAIVIGRRNQHKREGPRSRPDRHTIVARLPRNHGHDQARLWFDQNGNHGHDHQWLMATIIMRSWSPIGTQSRIKRPAIFGRKSSITTDVSPPYSLTFDWFVKQLSEFGAKS